MLNAFVAAVVVVDAVVDVDDDDDDDDDDDNDDNDDNDVSSLFVDEFVCVKPVWLCDARRPTQSIRDDEPARAERRWPTR